MSRVKRRVEFMEKLNGLISTHEKILIVKADFVGSRQMAEIRLQLRGIGTLLMGKNTMIRRVLKELEEKFPKLQSLIPEVRLNVGLVFCISDPIKVRETILSNKLPATAKEGAIAPVDVIVPAGLTGLDSNQTNFFQALNIATKITKSQIEILTDQHIIRKGNKVGASEAALLKKLNICPFEYSLIPQRVYDSGSVYDSDVLDMSDDDVLKMFTKAVQNVAAFSRVIGIPTEASVVHSLIAGFRNCAGLCIESGDFCFPEMKGLKDFVDNPDKFAVAATTAAPAEKAEKAVAAAEESEPEEEEDMGFSLFD